MAILHVRNVPDEVYEEIKRRASRQRRSLSGEVVKLLEAALEREGEAPDAVYERIRRRRLALEQSRGTLPSSVDLIRADRDR